MRRHLTATIQLIRTKHYHLFFCLLPVYSAVTVDAQAQRGSSMAAAPQAASATQPTSKLQEQEAHRLTRLKGVGLLCTFLDHAPCLTCCASVLFLCKLVQATRSVC